MLQLFGAAKITNDKDGFRLWFDRAGAKACLGPINFYCTFISIREKAP